MRIINKGRAEIVDMTPRPLEAIERAGRTCYRSEDKITEGSARRFVAQLLLRGHHAMIEMAGFTARFCDISRGVSHALVRHRLASMAQESTIWMDYSRKGELGFVPNDLPLDEKIFETGREAGYEYTWTLRQWLELTEAVYLGLRKMGYKPRSARQVLPIGTRTELVFRANMRQWRHIFAVRSDPTDHPETRAAVHQLLCKAQAAVPVMFDDFVSEVGSYEVRQISPREAWGEIAGGKA